MLEIGNRARALPAPPHVVWADLVSPRSSGVRAWLVLRADEVAPTVVEAEEHALVVWSSLWPARPEDQVRLTLEPRGPETLLRFRLLTPGTMPGDATLGHLRHRLNHLLFAELRFSYGQ